MSCKSFDIHANADFTQLTECQIKERELRCGIWGILLAIQLKRQRALFPKCLCYCSEALLVNLVGYVFGNADEEVITRIGLSKKLQSMLPDGLRALHMDA